MKTFPIQTHPRFAMGLPRGVPAPPCPTEIPWDMITPHEGQALRYHSQTIKRLAERGGLSPSEAVAILEDRDWYKMTAKYACARLSALVREFEASRLTSRFPTDDVSLREDQEA